MAAPASFTHSAMWAAIDGYRFDAAPTPLRACGRSWRDVRRLRHPVPYLVPTPEVCTAKWRSLWMRWLPTSVARQLPVTRRDPMFAALAMRIMPPPTALPATPVAARQAIGHAQEAFERGIPEAPRPMWMAAMGNGAEIEELALSAHIRLGNYVEAEAHAHRSLALLQPYIRRDRAVVTARLALAQLGQGDLEPAVSTALSVAADPTGQHPRVTGILADFGRTLRRAAPSSQPARTWDQHLQDSPKRAR